MDHVLNPENWREAVERLQALVDEVEADDLSEAELVAETLRVLGLRVERREDE